MAGLLAAGGAVGHFLTGTKSTPSAPLAGWGPERPVYWCTKAYSCDGADHVAFNSYANTPEYGDERAFVDAKPSRARHGHFADLVSVRPGEQVLVRLYVDNAAWAAKVVGSGGVAIDTKARVSIPLTATNRHFIYGFISARNAEPKVVWDGVTLSSDGPTTVRFVFGSAQWWSQPLGRELPVSDSVMEEGTLIGSAMLNGRFDDDFKDSGLLTFRVQVARA